MIPDVDSKTQTEGHVNNTVQGSEFKSYHIVLFEWFTEINNINWRVEYGVIPHKDYTHFFVLQSYKINKQKRIAGKIWINDYSSERIIL